MWRKYYSAVLALLSALQANALPYYDKPGNTCLCPPRYVPVCGSDGQLYDNECQLYCQNQGQRTTVIVECGNGCPCKEGCFCPAIYSPVCGSDGKTYGNSCELSCRNEVLEAKGKKKIKQVTKGECPPRNRCACPRNYDPVCGSDGITYANPCTLDCENYRREQNNLRLIWVVFNGKCPEIENCLCTADFSPVCGTDNRTYSNECKLFCERKPGLTVDCFKACPCDEGCFCTKEYNPVCGSDGKTYGNPCMFDCENKRLKSLGLKKIWQVKKGECPTDECNCSKEYIPVCGSNNKTYNNKCELACENRHRKPPVTIACGYACPCKKG